MGETRFTPGPWTFDWSVSMHDRSDLPCVIDADRLVVAQCWDDGHSEDECAANARLIAAAPDLYEALTEIVGMHACFSSAPEWQRARAALAKAASSQTDDSPHEKGAQDA